MPRKYHGMSSDCLSNVVIGHDSPNLILDIYNIADNI